MIFDVMKANDKNDQDAADIVCDARLELIANDNGDWSPPPTLMLTMLIAGL